MSDRFADMVDRWAAFTDAELLEIWEGLVEYDGTYYLPGDEDRTPWAVLIRGIRDDASRRGLDLQGVEFLHLGRPSPVPPRDPVETWAEYQARHRA